MNRNVIIFSNAIFDKNKDKNGLVNGFPNHSEFVSDIISLCKKHNILWIYETEYKNSEKEEKINKMIYAMNKMSFDLVGKVNSNEITKRILMALSLEEINLVIKRMKELDYEVE